MNRKWILLLLICTFVSLGSIVLYRALRAKGMTIETYTDAGRLPRIRPDYVGTTIPPNIAALNFCIQEPGDRYCVRIHSTQGQTIEIVSTTSAIHIPLGKWRKLLRMNRGNPLFLDVYVMGEDDGWTRYETIANRIADDDIDGHIAYRMLKPNYNYWVSVGIYQRDLTDWNESVILHGRSFKKGCVNCHTFLNNNPRNMFVGVRSEPYGSSTLLASKAKVDKIGAKWGYTAWHPSGRVAVYTIMEVRQFFHATGMEVRDVVDLDAGLLYYDLDARVVRTCPGISDKERLETYPTWSPDGRYLYFCSAPILWKDRNTLPLERYDEVKYDLRRIGYDVETDKWGEPETVLSAEETGLSILLPRISPDGRFLLFCMCKYGCFPVYQPSSDLYMMNLETGKYRKLAINSPFSESWHSWSSNGRWIAFSSKRRGGLFTRLYISYVDTQGRADKPFILPQKDPLFYDSFLETYSVPEFITGPVEISRRALTLAVRRSTTIEVANPLITGATPKATRTEASEPWRQGPR